MIKDADLLTGELVVQYSSHRIGSEHQSSSVEVNGLYQDLLTANTAATVTGFPKETRSVQSYFKRRACPHVKTAARRFASAVPVERYVYKWRL